uniref:Major facilitator superfamily (MFS) profile domain-containing protein n=1 Tax=Panagrolaimus sp. JU765 TaxID=591449 RepID=A0AC34RPA6_9BILA
MNSDQRTGQIMDIGHGKRALVFTLTFISYALYHASRKNLSGVKSSISRDWLGNDSSNPHPALFPNENQAKNFLGSLDGLFMIFYAAALFFWGWLGDRWDPKHVTVLGMIASAISLTLFGSVPYWVNFYSISFYIFIYCIFGVVQACGWPNEVTIMANWFPKQNRGAVMGAWAACQPVGNIVGALVISLVIPLGYQWTFAFNAALILAGACQPVGNIVGALVISLVIPLGYQWTFAFNAVLILAGGLLLHSCITTKPPKSSNENSRNVIDSETTTDEDGNHVADGVEEINHTPITFWQAICLPNVLAYCLCNACVKMVNYAFFFWLPFYLTHKYGWSEAEANQLAIWYDIGGVLGSIAGGIVSDRLGHRSPIIMSMLVASLFSLFIYADIGPSKLFNVFMMTVLGVTISGPYNLIVGTISVDLGTQPALAGNEKAMSTVTGLIDGTGSAGSAIGQFFVPVIQNAFGWTYVFYMFIIMNLLSSICLIRRFYSDSIDIWRNYRRRGGFTVRQQSLEDEPLLGHDD